MDNARTLMMEMSVTAMGVYERPRYPLQFVPIDVIYT